MCVMFIVTIVGMVIYAGVDMMGLADVQLYEAIVNAALGFVLPNILKLVIFCDISGD